MKTYSQKSSEIKREWYVIDASTLPLGKLAVVIADKLMGKSKVTYTPHTDNGDYVIVVNAKDLRATGNKMTDKMYYRHSGFPGGIKALKLEEVIEKNPAVAISEAVRMAKMYDGNDTGAFINGILGTFARNLNSEVEA